ncbi:MAG TPA: hypothetical protein VHF92_01890 [Geodermatophilus sp.]|nr:hypothetical protein [Geodermatophilus sp.]
MDGRSNAGWDVGVVRMAGSTATAGAVADPGWTWPPSASLPYAGNRPFVTEEWAPRSCVRHPWVRLGRWTLLYRRAA